MTNSATGDAAYRTIMNQCHKPVNEVRAMSKEDLLAYIADQHVYIFCHMMNPLSECRRYNLWLMSCMDKDGDQYRYLAEITEAFAHAQQREDEKSKG